MEGIVLLSCCAKNSNACGFIPVIQFFVIRQILLEADDMAGCSS